MTATADHAPATSTTRPRPGRGRWSPARVLAGRTEREITAALDTSPDFLHLDAHALELTEVWAAIELERQHPADVAAVFATGAPSRLRVCWDAARVVLAAQ